MSKIKREVPSKLYHYTNLDSIIGITSNKEFWLSNLYYQNDKNEFEIGIELFKKQLLVKKEEFKDSFKVSIFLDNLGAAIKYLETSTKVNTLSLSEEPDLLSQWRGYSDNCRGARIELTSLVNVTGKHILLLPCLYDETDHLDYVNYIFDFAIRTFEETKEEGIYNNANYTDEMKPYTDALNKGGSAFISSANVACSIIKNKSFSEEKEWRLVNFENNEVFFRTRDHYILPFIKMKIPQLPSLMTDVMICVSPEYEITQKSIRFLLDNKGFAATKISKSQIPYRA